MGLGRVKGLVGESRNAQSAGNAGKQPATHTGNSTPRPVCDECGDIARIVNLRPCPCGCAFRLCLSCWEFYATLGGAA